MRKKRKETEADEAWMGSGCGAFSWMGDPAEKEPPLAVVAAASCDGSNGGVRENANVQIVMVLYYLGHLNINSFYLENFLLLSYSICKIWKL